MSECPKSRSTVIASNVGFEPLHTSLAASTIKTNEATSPTMCTCHIAIDKSVVGVAEWTRNALELTSTHVERRRQATSHGR